MATIDSRCSCGAAAWSNNTFTAAPGQANAAHCPNNANSNNGHVYQPIAQGQQAEKQRAQSEAALLHTSEYYCEKYKHLEKVERNYDFIGTFTKPNGMTDRSFVNSLNGCCKMMEEIMNSEYKNENEMNSLMSNIMNKILSILDNKNNKEMECIAMFDKKFYGLCDKMPDNIIGISKLFYKYPGSLSGQIIMEGKLGKYHFKKKDIGQLACYLRIQLLENEASKSLGILYNERYFQFFMIKKENPKHLFQSKCYLLNSIEAMKLLYYFLFEMQLKDEFLSKFLLPPQWFHDNNISILGIIGKGGSCYVYGINVFNYSRFENINNDSNNNKGDYIRAALKICDKKMFNQSTGGDFEISDTSTYDTICERESKYFDKMKNIKEEMTKVGDKRHFSGINGIKIDFDEPRKKRQRTSNKNKNKNENENKNYYIYIMPLLRKIISDDEKEDCAMDISNGLQLFHENGLFHCDLYWRNILTDNNGKLYIIDYQKMQESTLDCENEETFELLLEDLENLYQLFELPINEEQYQQFEDHFKKGQIDKVFQHFQTHFQSN